MAPRMTSATRRGRRPKRWNSPRRRPRTETPPCRHGRGLTLVEVLLATSLVVVLLTLGVVNYTEMYAREKLGEGLRRMDSLLRMARADAAARGRRVRLTFDEATGEAAILWEPDPLAEPGEFVPHTAAAWAWELPNDLVRFRRCQRTGDSALRLTTYGQDEPPVSEAGEPLEPVTFLPDGTFDSAVIELTGREEAETRIGRIVLDGPAGTITSRLFSPTELEEQIEIEAQEAEGW